MPAFAADQHTLTPLKTGRDMRMENILQESGLENQSLLLAERSARLSALRNQYRDAFERPDLAAYLAVKSISSFDSQKRNASGLSAELHGLLQFGGDWQSQFGWYYAQSLSLTPSALRRTSAELPELNYAVLSYGRDRSVETRVGLLPDIPLLSGTSPQPLFSGISVALHPVSQKLSTNEPQVLFEIEHAWSHLFHSPDVISGRASLQRTRPRLSAALEQSNWSISSHLGLEWYSDSQGILGRTIAQRPFDERYGQSNKDTQETRWRLFAASISGKLNHLHKRSVSFAAERVSNTIGRTSRPALSGDLNFHENFFLAKDNLTAGVTLRVFDIPRGSVPPARLPLELSPGSQGQMVNLSFGWNPKEHNNQSLQIELSRMSERQHPDPQYMMRCSGQSAAERTLSTESCITGMIHLTWTVNLVPNL